MTAIELVRESIRESVLDAVAVVLPVACSGCGAADRAVCSACAAALAPRPRLLTLTETGGPPAWAALDYEGVPRRVLLACKDGGRTDAAPALARALRSAVHAAMAESDIAALGVGGRTGTGGGGALLPVLVPSTREAFRQRGYHPTGLILRRARILVPPLWRALRLARQTADQAGLSRVEREGNRRGSLVASRRLHGRNCLIVDDILTTGATAREAARAIDAVGGRAVAIAVIAHTALRGTRGGSRSSQSEHSADPSSF